jgi:undecaprenyl-phosphate galactose phosphotransferase
VIFIAYFLAYTLRSDILPALFSRFKTPLFPFSVFLNHFYAALVWIFIFAYEKLYTKRYPFWEEAKILLKSTTLSTVFIMIMIFVTRSQVRYSRTIVILAWLLSLFLFPLFRYLMKSLLVKTRLWNKKLIILGVHQTSLLVLQNIKKNKTMGYEVLGFLDEDPKKIGKKFLGIKVLGPFSALEDIKNTYRSKDIMVATPHLPRKKLKDILAKCEDISESMWLIPRSGDFITEGVELEVIGDILTLYIKKNLAKPWNIFIKSLFDKMLTLLIFIFFLPLLGLIAMAIKLDSKGPVFFVQLRIGKNKKMFNLYKFRSMHHNSDKKLYEYLENHPEAKEEWERYKKIKNHDPRVTRVGKWIRKYSLDELPQLINILRDEMSLVGPRPYLYEELKGKDTFISRIAKVKPGITGLWQISGRSELLFEQRIDLDEYYIRNWSLWLDIIILIKSVKVLFSSKGAY